jgi:hypothetical protein
VFIQLQFGVQMTVLLSANLLPYRTSAYLPPVHASQDFVSPHIQLPISINYSKQLTGHSPVKKIKWYLRTAPKIVLGPKRHNRGME